MAYDLFIKPSAEKDLIYAIDWYEERRPGLGLSLYHEISEVLEQIALYPEYFQKKYRTVRVRFTKRFNFGVHYIFDGSKVYVLAILHTSRKPLQ
ncbi:type II toxin-antitoxin system RelE/ParE family toxin [Croceimicrobium hydrocarbonivorans]|uniref:Type II toxin-antitoxin system RelE/ParE family toxin n=1 Tax=Croceimicrobium hydrocarbonivorans TaxID=2761580 RepID=A0A7H0VHT1_9FLAO|nr:type II toxin-antitoxin system RelE/ParE family toxin [Croceimicrobium hydrocarbonivorans]QNR25279.1 type II toxin-antitoxin system RelE/ParE family toxin [Croceimicrobium hydrocarbonivorans]